MAVYVSIALVVGYLCGSISFARIVSHVLSPEDDITDTKLAVPGSGDSFRVSAVSATSVSLHHGTRAGFVVMILDIAKVALPGLAMRLALPQAPYFLLTVLAGMAGQIWPLYYRFRGGRGVTAAYGGLLSFDPLGMLVTSVGGMFLGLLVARDVLIAYMAGLWLMMPWLWWRTGDWRFVAYALGVNVLFVLAAIPDLQQYIHYGKQGALENMSEAMRTTGMGRGILKVARLLGVMKEGPE